METVQTQGRFVLDGDRIRAFADATGCSHRAYRQSRAVVPPTYLCGTDDLAGPDGLTPERDCRFFRTPPRAGDLLTVVVRDGDHDRLTEYRDADGLLIADAWIQGSGHDTEAVGLLADYATGWLGAESVRRFRTRLLAPVPATDLACTGEVVQEYTADGEPRIDVVVSAAAPGGAVVARAWATFARAA